MKSSLNSLAALLLSALILIFSPAVASAMDDAELDALYQAGKGYYDQKQYKLAFPFIHEAAKQGHPEAQMRAGKMFFNGWGIKHNHHVAKEWHQKAAAQGNKESIEKLKKWKH
jgi:TPR repeat protein